MTPDYSIIQLFNISSILFTHSQIAHSQIVNVQLFSYSIFMKYKIKHTQGLLETLLEVYKGISKQKAKQILAHSDFMVDGKPIDKHPETILFEGNELEIISKGDVSKPQRIRGKKRPVTIFYEDKYLLAALKPAGFLSCASKHDKVDYSFHKELEHFVSERDEKKTRLFICHRIDREVEGILMFAKTEELQEKVKEKEALLAPLGMQSKAEAGTGKSSHIPPAKAKHNTTRHIGQTSYSTPPKSLSEQPIAGFVLPFQQGAVKPRGLEILESKRDPQTLADMLVAYILALECSCAHRKGSLNVVTTT